MTLIELVKNHIEKNINTTKLKFGDNLFINTYPDTPDLIVSVIDMGGFPPPVYTPTREKIIEIKLRVADYINGNILGEEIFHLFHDIENYYLNGTRILNSYARTEVLFLYKDQNERDEFSIEFVFLIENKKKIKR